MAEPKLTSPKPDLDQRANPEDQLTKAIRDDEKKIEVPKGLEDQILRALARKKAEGN